MKKTITFIIAAFFTVVLSSQVQAKDKAMNGLLIGAGGGAILGQAIGSDTESTLIGTAVGGVLGYIIGKEHQKYHPYSQRVHYSTHEYRDTHQYNKRRPHYKENHHTYKRRPHYKEKHHTYKKGRHWRQANKGRFCKQTERTIVKHGRTKTIIKKICTDNTRDRHRKASRRHFNNHNDWENNHYVRYRW